MRYVRYKYCGQVGYGCAKDDILYALGEPPFGDLHAMKPVADLDDVTLLSPVIPGKIIGVARNSSTLAKERGWVIPLEPEFFLKPPSSVIGPGEPILCPPESQEVVHEAELALVVAKKARHTSADEALGCLLGYTCANDVTARDLMLRDRLVARSKSYDTFCPLGPMIVTDPPMPEARIICRVNGEVRQDVPLTDYVFPPATLISYLSRIMTLLPGDVLLCGSSAGIGPLRPGDQVEVAIDGIGILRNPVKAKTDQFERPSKEEQS
jgi:2-keto-4-pentenoate hydratase/2-oxohepta-3-ene-1,7-dioic acid hydratase in catechol pathway